MSADKPIQRYNHDLFMDSDGAWVSHDDHLAAIRKARAEAFEECAELCSGFCHDDDSTARMLRHFRDQERTQ